MLKRQGREVGEGRASGPGVGEVEQEECKKQGREVGGVEEEESKDERGQGVGVGMSSNPANDRVGTKEWERQCEEAGENEQVWREVWGMRSIEQESERDCEKKRQK